MTTPQHDPNLLAYLQAWRQYLEQLASAAVSPGLLIPAAPLPPSPPIPFAPPALPPMPPSFGAPPAFPSSAPADHTQQLLATLQAWRQYLEQSAGPPPAPPSTRPQPSAAPSRPMPDRLPPLVDDGGRSSGTPAPQADTSAYGSSPVRVGSAYRPEAPADAHLQDPPPSPQSLYSAAAEPDSGPGTEWWNSTTHGATAPSGAGLPDSDTSKPAPGADQTQQTDPDDGGDGSSGAKLVPPKWQELVKPLDPGGSLHPAITLPQHGADVLSVRPAHTLGARAVAPRRV